MAATDRRLQGKPFRMLAVSVGPGGSERGLIRTACRNSGLACSVMAGGQYPGYSWAEVPHAVLFDPEGREIFQGELPDAVKAAEKAAETAPRVWLDKGRFPRLGDLTSQIMRGEALGQAALSLRRRAKGGDPGDRAQAEALLEVLEHRVVVGMAVAGSFRSSDPEASLAMLRALAQEFSGDSLGERLAEKVKQTASEPALIAFRKAQQEVASLERQLEALSPCKSHKQHGRLKALSSCEDCRKVNERALAPILKALDDVVRRVPGTTVADDAQDLTESWTLKHLVSAPSENPYDYGIGQEGGFVAP